MSDLKTHGFMLIDVDGAALNNAGSNPSSNYDNSVATKKLSKNGDTYAKVSGESLKSWWRDTLMKKFNWDMSPISRIKKSAYTECNPILYPDDDVFGYMKAAKDVKKDDDGNIILNKNGKEESTDVTVTRTSTLFVSILKSIVPIKITDNFSIMSRQFGDGVPYGYEDYSCVLQGMFSIDLNRVGTFSNYNKSGYMNISQKLINENKELLDIIDSPYYKDEKGNPCKLYRMYNETRKQRITDTISALKYLNGGAKQANNMCDVSPKFLILCTTDSGNHPFFNIISSTGKSKYSGGLNIEAIREILEDYKDDFKGTIFIGKRKGFFDEYESDLVKLTNDFDNVKFGSINSVISEYCEQIKTQL